MALTNYPQGLTSFGIPVLPSVAEPFMGNVYFVHSTNGKDGNEGTDKTKPLASLDKAISKCTANNGDVIYLLPGHTESLEDATGFQVDTAGISIIGCGRGNARPKFTFDNTAASVELDAANTLLKNIVFEASVSAVVVGVNFDADHCAMLDCEFNYADTGDDFILMVDIDAVDYASVVGCKFYGEHTTGWAKGVRLDDANYACVCYNHFDGQWTSAAIIGEGALGVGLYMGDNRIYSSITTTDGGIDLQVAFTGLLWHNAIGTLYTTAVDGVLDPGSCLCLHNHGANAIDEKAIGVPTTAAT